MLNTLIRINKHIEPLKAHDDPLPVDKNTIILFVRF